MKKLVSGLVAAIFALSSLAAMACPGDKTHDEKQISTPTKPKV